MRAVAALCVFVFHAGVGAGLSKRVMPPIVIGGMTVDGVPSPVGFLSSGVNLFFVLSGFLMVLQGRRGALAAGARVFWRRRAARLLPSYWTALIVAMALAPAASRADLRPAFWLHLFVLHGFDRSAFIAVNAPMWSLATEWQFYLLFPFAFRWLDRVGYRRFFWGAALLALALRTTIFLVPWPPVNAGTMPWVSLVGYQLPGRLLEFALGMTLAEFWLATPAAELARRGRAVAVLACVPMIVVRLARVEILTDPLLGVFYVGVVAWWLGRPLRAGAARSWWHRVGTSFGRQSYSFFLLHVPLLGAFAPLIAMGNGLWTRFALALATFPLAWLAAALMYRVVEQPACRWLRGDSPATGALRGV